MKKSLRTIGLALALLIGMTTPALASNFGALFADGANHIFIYVGLTTNFANASNDARSTDLNPTDLVTGGTSDHNAADVAVYDQDDGDSGYYGYSTCVTVLSTDATRCDHWHSVFNLWAGLNWGLVKRNSVACHEFGHTVGLKDSNANYSCMHNDTLFPTAFHSHDISHINGKY